MAALLTTILAFGLFGCKKERPISGGTTDKSDPNAPKEIKSKDIAEFKVNFSLDTRKNINGDSFYYFVIKNDDNGVLTAFENRLGISHEADEELLNGLQEIIDKYRLVLYNGVYRVTAGLPPEYQSRTLNVIYKSGEALNYTENNNPSEKWTAAVYDLFAKWFADRGIDSLYPERENSQVIRMDIEKVENSIVTKYETMIVGEDKAIDGEKRLLTKVVYDNAKQELIMRKFIKIPEDYYKNLTEILRKYDFDMKYEFSYFEHQYGYYGFSEDFNRYEPDTEDLIHFYIEYESENRMSLETKKASEIDAMKDLMNDLCAYNEPLFE